MSDSGSAAREGPDSDDGASLWYSDDDGSDDDERGTNVNVNERRTRRGVYAVVEHRLDDTECDGDAASELTSIPSSRSSTGVPLTAIRTKGNGLLTPDPEPISLSGWHQQDARDGASISAVSTPRKSRATSVSTSATRFQSVISTRGQKARAAASEEPVDIVGAEIEIDAEAEAEDEAEPDVMERSKKDKGKSRASSSNRQLVTPPLTADSASASSRLQTRSTSKSKGRGSRGGRSSVARSTADDSSSMHPDADHEAENEHEIEPDGERRNLRSHGRARMAVPEMSGERLREAVSAPRGVDGKPLPTCVTCQNVLPVISVDSQVVWGLSLGRTGKRGRPRKHLNVECPR